ncbi:MAG: hypothetical protein ACYCW6_15015 [Candidatus Xenobia bacterium]
MKVAMARFALVVTLTLPACADTSRPPLPRDPFQKPTVSRPQTPDRMHLMPQPHAPVHQAPAPTRQQGTPPARVDVALMGVLQGSHNVALLVQHNTVLTVHEGDHIGTARVTAIRPDRVDLQNGADTIVMRLHPRSDQKQNMPCGQVLS